MCVIECLHRVDVGGPVYFVASAVPVIAPRTARLRAIVLDLWQVSETT